MESVKPNATTKEIRGTNSQQNGENDRQRLETVRGGSFVDGTRQQNRSISRHCPEDDSYRNAYPRGEEVGNGSGVGKILEEVLLLKQQFLDYVKSDQNQLEARLDESRQQEQQFLSNAERIEKRLRTALAVQVTEIEETSNHG